MPLAATVPPDLISAVPQRPPRFLLYSHDGCDLGHLRRNVTLAGALVDACPGAAVLIASGSESLDGFAMPPSVDVLRLPGLRKVDNHRYAPRRLAVDSADVRALRAALLAAAVEAFRPDVVLADKHPAGVHGELVPALEVLASIGGRAAFGLRDVLDGAEAAARTWRDGARDAVVRHHDLVLVYGQRELLDPLAGSGLEGRSDVAVRYCGYVVAPTVRRPAAATPAGRTAAAPRVIASAGGGEDGTAVLSAFLTAARGAPWEAVAVTGPHADPSDRLWLEHLGSQAGASVVASIPELGSTLGDADVVVCMGGYNSLVEAAAVGVPAVCVPRVTPRTEQLVRARAFADRGLVRLVTPAELDPQRLRAEVDAAVGTDRAALARRIDSTLEFDGAPRAAATLLELAGLRTPTAAHLRGVPS